MATSCPLSNERFGTGESLAGYAGVAVFTGSQKEMSHGDSDKKRGVAQEIGEGNHSAKNPFTWGLAFACESSSSKTTS